MNPRPTLRRFFSSPFFQTAAWLAALCLFSFEAQANPPLATTQPAYWVGSSNAVLTGMATPNGLPTSVWFEWGTDTNYGNATDIVYVGNSNGVVVAVTGAVDGLIPWRSYHFRLVTVNVDGTTYGGDQALAVGKVAWVWGNSYSGQTNLPVAFTNAVQLAGGGVHSLALTTDGRVTAWGNNQYGQATVPSSVTNVLVIASGYYHSLALKSDGTVAAWGNNTYGQTNVPASASNVVAIAGGYYHSVALRADGRVVAWGQNSSGQTNVPAAASNIVAIAAGGSHNIALRNDGVMIGWGDNSAGQITIPAGLDNVVAITAGGRFSAALKSDGTVLAWGDNSAGELSVPAGLNNVVAIAAGDYHCEALKSDGTAVGWGYDFYHQTDTPAATTNLTAIAAGGDKSMALGLDVAPVVTNMSVFGFANVPIIIPLNGTDANADPLTFRITQLPANGTLYQHDINTFFGAPIVDTNTVVTDPNGWVVFLSATNSFGLPYTSFQFVANDGTYDSFPGTVVISLAGPPYATTEAAAQVTASDAVLQGMATANYASSQAWFQWGTSTAYGNVTTARTIGTNAAVRYTSARVTGLAATVPYHYRLVVSNQANITYGADQVFGLGKSIQAWGDDTAFQIDVPTNSASNAVYVAAGYFHNLAVLPDGSLEGWGDDGSGQIDVPTGNNFVQVAGGDVHSLALRSTFTVAAWGDNTYGQTNVPTLAGVLSVAAGGYHNLAVTTNGVVRAWGANINGQTNVPVGLSNVVGVAAGFAHSLALKNDGTVVAWGDNTYGQTYVPVNASNIVAVAAGRYFSLALKNDGTVLAWGDNSSGQTAVPPGLVNVGALAGGGAHVLSLLTGSTVTAWGFDDYGQTDVPATATNVIGISAGQFHSLALVGDLPPVASAQTVDSGPTPGVNITLQGSDPDNDPLTFIVTTIPVLGTLYQYDSTNSIRGPAILTNNTPVTDPTGAVLFVPDPGGFGTPYATFQMAVTDGVYTSAPVTITINISGPLLAPFAATLAPSLVTANTARLNGMATPNGNATSAWFEWGTSLAYGNATPTFLVGSGNSVVEVSQTISGLIPTLPYHCRLAVSGPAGIFYGGDQVFGASKKIWGWGNDTSGQIDIPSDLTNIVGLAAGYSNSFALTTNATGEGWGANDAGQATVPALTNVVQFAGGRAHSLALLADGSVAAWGDNTFGQTTVPSLSAVVAIAAGGNHNLALKANGTVTAWGANSSGQTNVPGGLSNVVAVAAGLAHSLVLKNDGTVQGWGNNAFGQVNPPFGLTNVVAIAAGLNFSVALKKDGTVTAWGDNSTGQTTVPPGVNNVLAIAAGGYHCLALKNDGTVAAWGANTNGQIIVPSGATNIIGLAAGLAHSMAFSADNRPTAIGQNIVTPVINSILITLAATDPDNDPLSFAIATLPPAGNLYQNNGGTAGAQIVANNTPVTDPGGQVIFVPAPGGIGSPYASFQFTATDGAFVSLPATITITIITPAPPFATTLKPTLIAATTAQLNGMATANYAPATAWFEWGATANYGNTTPAQPIGSNAVVTPVAGNIAGLVATVPYHGRLVVSNGLGAAYGADTIFGVGKALWSWGDDSLTQIDFPADLVTNVSSLAAGYFHSLAVKTDFSGEGWGDNGSGEATVPAGNNIAQLAGGDFHSVALLLDGSLAAWGDNSYGQTAIPGGANGIVSVAAGGYHNLALKNDGTLMAWGANGSGQIAVPAGLSNVVAVAAGFAHSMALRNDGAIFCWGDNTYGQLSIPAGMTNIVSLAAGRNYCLALASNGVVYGWGDNSAGQLSIPANATNVVAVAAGGSHCLALRGDGTLVSWGFDNSGQTDLPVNATNIIAIAAGAFHSLATSGDNAPTATPQTITSPQVINLPVTLTGTDPDGDALTSQITALPSFGTLYQFNAGQRGIAILAPNTPVTDPGGQVIFVPDPGGHGSPYASFQFSVSDGIYTSAPAAITINIVGPPPSTNQSPAAPYVTTQAPSLITPATATLNGMATANYTPTTAWFEWGTTTNYSQRTPATALNTNNGVSRVSQAITGLLPTIPYHFRMVASNQVATVKGADQVFGVAKAIWAWGDNTFGQTNLPTNLTARAVGIADGYFHSLAVLADGTGAGWGDNGFNQTAISATGTIIQMAGGDLHTVALISDGTVACFGDDTYGQTDVPAGLAGVMAVASGGYHNLALTTNGTVLAWGANNSGQVNVPGANNIVAIAAGFAHSMALRNDGALLVWGDNTYGQANVPPNATNIVAIAAGRYYSAALRSDGNVVAWGDNSAGQLNIPASASNIVALAAGNSHLVALRSDGKLVSWGLNNFGQTNIALAGTNLFFAVAAGEYHSMAMSADNRPVVAFQTINNPQTNILIVITLGGSDPDPGDAAILTFRTLTVPALGTLYQFNPATSNRGPAILNANTPVTDPGGRVIFVPNPGGYGAPYASFDFVANDGVYDSSAGTILINIPGKPFVTTLLPVQFSRTNATLNGIIYPNMTAATAFFQWGLTTNYGSNTVITNVGAGTTGVAVFTNVLNLLSGATYHYRIIGSNSFGTNVGADVSFAVPVPPYFLTNSVVTNAGAFQFKFTGVSNAVYSVWASTNFTNWIKIGTASQPTPGNFIYVDTAATNYPRRFYQVIWP